MIEEEIIEKLKQLEPEKALELILRAATRAYPDMSFQIEGYKIPTKIEIPSMKGTVITATYTNGDEQ